jgi:hypothetical protein
MDSNSDDGVAQTAQPFDIYMVGLGIVSVRQVTREAEAALRSSTTVFVVDAGFGVTEYLESLGPKVVDLLPLYKEGGSRDLVYRRMAALVVQAALHAPPVTFATYGHPMVFSYPPLLIRRAAQLLELRTHTIPGVSALDTLIVDLGFDPGLEGLQMYEATDVLLRERPLQPDVPLLLWQVAAVESGLFSSARGNADRFRNLQDYLLRFYPGSHRVTIAQSASFPLLGPILESFPLQDMATHLADGPQSGTLFVPPVQRRALQNEQLLAEVYSTDHLQAITGDDKTAYRRASATSS